MVKYTLNYFDAAGRGETVRLLFHAVGVEFTDNRMTSEQWKENKPDTRRFPMGQMPTLEADDQVICQSNAICRFVANELGLYGTNSQEKAVIDQVCETLNDIGSELIKIFFGGLDEETKKTKLMEFFGSDKFKVMMGFMVKLLKNNKDGAGFFVGNKISLADASFYGLQTMMKANLDDYPEIKALCERVENVEGIKKYLDSRK